MRNSRCKLGYGNPDICPRNFKGLSKNVSKQKYFDAGWFTATPEKKNLAEQGPILYLKRAHFTKKKSKNDDFSPWSVWIKYPPPKNEPLEGLISIFDSRTKWIHNLKPKNQPFESCISVQTLENETFKGLICLFCTMKWSTWGFHFISGNNWISHLTVSFHFLKTQIQSFRLWNEPFECSILVL